MQEIFSLLGAGLLEAVQPLNLMMIVIGCTIGPVSYTHLTLPTICSV